MRLKRVVETGMLAAVAFVLSIIISVPFAEALSISSVRATDVTDSAATVQWVTDEASDGVVSYGKGKELGQTKAGSAAVKEHSILVGGLEKGTSYLFKVRASTEKASVEDDNKGALYSFTTAAKDTFPPPVKVSLPASSNKARIDIVGETEPGTVDLKLFVNNELTRAYETNNGKIEFYGVTLKPEGDNTLRVEVVDSAKNANSATFNIFVDLVPPTLKLEEVPSVSEKSEVMLAGKVSENAKVEVFVNDESIFSEEVKEFSQQLNLEEGENIIVVAATDKAGNSDRMERSVFVDTQPPEISEVSPEDGAFYYEGRAIDTVAGKTEPGATVYMYVAGIFVTVPSESGQPPIKELIEKAQYKTTADSNGTFEFKEIDFEHPDLDIGEVAPQELPAGLTEINANEPLAEMENERAINYYLAAVDQVGQSTTQQHSVQLGTCFSGSFDFSIANVPKFQTPSLLSPMRLDSGTETASFVLGLEYHGQAATNLRDPKAKGGKDDNYYEIAGVDVQPNCRDSTGSGLLKGGFFDRHKSYALACQIVKGRPSLTRAINPERTNWYVRYNLGKTNKFTNTTEDFWKQFEKNEIRFPLKVTINYREKLPGKDEQAGKAQSQCREVSYFIDVPIDPRKVMPDGLLKGGQKAINETLNVLNKIIPPLEDAIKYVGIGCMGTFGLRLIIQMYRRFVENWDFGKCKALKIATLGKEECPIESKDQLNKCFYIKDSDKEPYPASALEVKGCPTGTNPGNKRADIEQVDVMMKHFGGTVNAWKLEAKLYTGYRFLCDRVFCHKAPAGWTREASVAYIKQRKFDEAACGAQGSNARTLTRVENCAETLGEKQQVITVTRRDAIEGNTCYTLGKAVYRVKASSSPDCGGKTQLERIDKREITREDSIAASDLICAVQVEGGATGGTYYTSDQRDCKDVCESGGKDWVIAPESNGCLTPDEAKKAGKIYYPAGPTKDCWIGAKGGSKTEKHQCYCWQKSKDEKKDEYKCGDSACYAGPETGKIDDTLSLKDKGGDAEQSSDEEWPWSYREWQVYRESGKKFGIYYPPERYYRWRDFPAAFGQNYLLDYIVAPPYQATEVNPFTDHIAAFQAVCLSGIRSRLILLRSVLQGLNNCLKQIETTGKADAGVCKEIFSQYVCSLVYKVFELFRNRCIGQPFQGGLAEGVIGDVELAFKSGASAVTDSMDSMASEVKDEYGNAKLDEFLEGGSQNMMKKVCLAAFGMDVGFDLNNFLDAAYSVPFVTSVILTSSDQFVHGAVGRREFLSFNPQDSGAVYEYRAAWVIFPGCDLESYQIDLAAVNSGTARESKNINCAEVGDRLPGSNGCDNWNGQREITQAFASGNRVKQGVYVDQNKALNVAGHQRFDHFKVTLNVDGKQDKSKCLPAENKNGVFYFPIRDATARDLVECSLDVQGGRFSCGFADLEGTGQTWIEDISCVDPRTTEHRRCDRVTLSAEEGDALRAEVAVFSSGQEKVCLETFALTNNGRKLPENSALIEVPGVGRPGVIPVAVNLHSRVTKDDLQSGDVVRVEPVEATGVKCSLLRGDREAAKDSAPDKMKHSPVAFTFVKDTTGYKVMVRKQLADSTVEALDGFTVDIPKGKLEGVLKKGGQETFTIDEIRGLLLRVNGYAFTSLGPDRSVSATDKFGCKVSTSYVPSGGDQVWKLTAKLYYPDENKQCVVGSSQPAFKGEGTAFDVEKTVDIRVRDKNVLTAASGAYETGKRFYQDARKEGNVRAQISKFQAAAQEFQRVALQPPVEGSREEFLSYFWLLASLAQAQFRIDKGETKTLAVLDSGTKGALSAFVARINTPAVGRNTKLLGTAELQLLVAYMGQLERRFVNEQKTPEPKKASAASCDECQLIDESWLELRDLDATVGTHPPPQGPFFDPSNGEWVPKSRFIGAGKSAIGAKPFDDVRNVFVKIIDDVIKTEAAVATDIGTNVPQDYDGGKALLTTKLGDLKRTEELKLAELEDLLKQVIPKQAEQPEIQNAKSKIRTTIDFLDAEINRVIIDKTKFPEIRLEILRKLGVQEVEKRTAQNVVAQPAKNSYLIILSGKPTRLSPVGFQFIDGNWRWKLTRSGVTGYNDNFYEVGNVPTRDGSFPQSYKTILTNLQKVSTNYNEGITLIVRAANQQPTADGLTIRYKDDADGDEYFSCCSVNVEVIKSKAKK